MTWPPSLITNQIYSSTLGLRVVRLRWSHGVNAPTMSSHPTMRLATTRCASQSLVFLHWGEHCCQSYRVTTRILRDPCRHRCRSSIQDLVEYALSPLAVPHPMVTQTLLRQDGFAVAVSEKQRQQGPRAILGQEARTAYQKNAKISESESAKDHAQ